MCSSKLNKLCLKITDNVYFFSIVISLIILFSFFYFQNQESKFLKLDVQWLILSFLPFLLALFFTGKLSKISMAGLEIEASVNNTPLKYFDNILVKYKCNYNFKQASKSNTNYLDRITNKHEIKILSFTTNNNIFYDFKTVADYLRNLPNISFFQLIDKKGNFELLIKIPNSLMKHIQKYNDFEFKAVKSMDYFNDEEKKELSELSSLINAINNEDFVFLKDNFMATNAYILEKDTLIECYEKFKEIKPIEANKDYKYLPVLNESKNLISVVDELSVKDIIVEESILYFKKLKKN